MRYLTYFVNDHTRIDISNSLLGTEKIYYNGELVSIKKSVLGCTHDFSVREDNEYISYRVSIEIKWPFRIGFDIFRNGKALLLS